MKGYIKNLGKNGTKSYFFIAADDGNTYFASAKRVINEDGTQPELSSIYPYIWVGSQVLSFNIAPAEKTEGRRNWNQAVDVVLEHHASGNARYWEGRRDALLQFRQWYKFEGCNLNPGSVMQQLNEEVFSSSKEPVQVASLGVWYPYRKKTPKWREVLLVQLYDVWTKQTYMGFAYREKASWYKVSSTFDPIPDIPDSSSKISAEGPHPTLILAWMELPAEYREHEVTPKDQYALAREKAAKERENEEIAECSENGTEPEPDTAAGSSPSAEDSEEKCSMVSVNKSEAADTTSIPAEKEDPLPHKLSGSPANKPNNNLEEAIPEKDSEPSKKRRGFSGVLVRIFGPRHSRKG